MQVSMVEANSIPAPVPAMSATPPVAVSPGRKRSAGEGEMEGVVGVSSDSGAAVMAGFGDDKENQNQNMGQGQGQGVAPAAKKRKLSPVSREAKQQEKEAKEKQKLEEKAKKEDEKARKEEEKRKRDAEKEEERKKREEKKKVKEEEKAAKEEEKRKKEEEKMKKERAQTRLNAFFVKPKPTGEQTTASISTSPKKLASEAPSGDVSRGSDYSQAFPEFFLQSHTSLAPTHRFERDSQALAHMQEKVDSYLKSNSASEEPLVLRPSKIFQMIPYQRRCGRVVAPVKDLLLKMQSLSGQPETAEAARQLQDSLKLIKMKSLKFGEDVRPPYQGTYSKQVSRDAAYKLMRNPFRRALPETNYDYDSEAEWEEPEEGEDLDSEEEEEGSEEGEDDMDGFLDDEDDQLADGKRRLLVGDLEPSCTGIRWHDQGVDPDLQVYKIETILPSVTFPIDPFSTAYWQKPKPEPVQSAGSGRSTLHAFMGNTTNAQHSGTVPIQDGSVVAGSGKPKRVFPMEQFAEFKQVVEGSDLTKTGLIEILKKRFPKVSKDTLKDTLNSVATRVGQKEAEKKWVCK